MTLFEVKAVNSLEKIFPSVHNDAVEQRYFTGARGEYAAFQLAMRSSGNWTIDVEMESDIKELITLHEVGLVPCTVPSNPADDFVLTHDAGLFPDPLPLLKEGKRLRLSPGHWHAVWVKVAIPEDFPEAGIHKISFKFTIPKVDYFPWEPPEMEAEYAVEFEILDYALPKQKLLNINWFHSDCLMTHFHTDAWSNRHWEILGKYMRSLFEHGGNVLLTPLWPLPLDVAVGHKRPDCQLLTITERDGKYDFDFTLLEKWLALARSIGFEYFEAPHLFSQWGVKSAPRVIVNGESRFGWECPANSAEYRSYLEQLLPQLTAFFDKQGLHGKLFFHISDEPPLAYLENYRYAASVVLPLVEDYPVIDALSDVDFYKTGAIKEPIPATPKFADFAQFDLKRRWVYYCGDYENGVPNRQFGLPSMRNRVFGILAYAEKIDGFLHWGFNFYFSQNSINWYHDVWKDPTGGSGFSGGGPFNVYPGEDGPVDSIHHEIFREGLQDLRACTLLEELAGKEAVMELLQKGLDTPLSLTSYPRSARWLLDVRRRLDNAILEKLQR